VPNYGVVNSNAQKIIDPEHAYRIDPRVDDPLEEHACPYWLCITSPRYSNHLKKEFRYVRESHSEPVPKKTSPMNMTMGEKIARLRSGLKLTQADFAKLVGVYRCLISDWEKGKTIPRGKALVEIKKLLARRGNHGK